MQFKSLFREQQGIQNTFIFMNIFIFTCIYANIWMGNKYLNVFYGKTNMSFI